jgi:hypothetical protein
VVVGPEDGGTGGARVEQQCFHVRVAATAAAAAAAAVGDDDGLNEADRHGVDIPQMPMRSCYCHR